MSMSSIHSEFQPTNNQEKEEPKLKLLPYRNIMNRKYLFFYDNKEVLYMPIDTDFNNAKFNKINLDIDKEAKDINIKDIRSGSNAEVIAIIVEDSVESDMVFTWNIEKNCVQQSYEVGKDYDLIWD